MFGSGYGRLAAVLLACGAVLSACGGGEGLSRPGSRIGEAGPVPGRAGGRVSRHGEGADVGVGGLGSWSCRCAFRDERA